MSAPNGIDWTAVQLALYTWVWKSSGLAADRVTWAQQDAPRVAAPAISMWLQHYEDAARAWVDAVPNSLEVTPKVSTGVNASSDVISFPAHGLVTGDGPFVLSTAGTAPGGLIAGRSYWVIVVDANSVKLASTYIATGGNDASGTNPVTPIDLTSAGSGAITLTATTSTARAGQEILFIARSVKRLLFTLECYTSDSVGLNAAAAVLTRVQSRAALPSLLKILDDANIGLGQIDRVGSVNGHATTALFEPRALVEIHLEIPCEESEVGQGFSSVAGQGQDGLAPAHISPSIT